jgi:hypothetical protein
LPSAIGVERKLNSIELISVHALEAPAEDEPLGSERSVTLEVDLSARFTTALFAALTAALLTALVTALL